MKQMIKDYLKYTEDDYNVICTETHTHVYVVHAEYISIHIETIRYKVSGWRSDYAITITN